MSFTSGGAHERRRRVSDPQALRALAHPLRLELLDRLMSFGEQTAAQCAEAVGSTASNCSYHLRALARVGLVEPGSSTDRRERPWRATATGLEFGPADSGSSAAAAGAAFALDELALSRDEELTRRAHRRRREQPSDWQAAEAFHIYGLRLTAAELAQLVGEIDRLVRPFIAMTRVDAPSDAEVASVRLLAFRHPQSP
ncbi:MAG: ArsR/SmtB family transcription factor [Solirubrobacteraceae bacterium]